MTEKKKNGNDDLPGFSFPTESQNEDEKVKKKSKSKKGGGFQAMGLSFPVYNGIIKRGYKIPTPIQRKTIPLILEGRDVVAMAKTGSGKTACFLIPLFEKLKKRQGTTGARALILSPTRELAIQTFKFIKDLGKFMDLKTILILGGDSMDYQFSALHSHPDVIVATPGRFLHVCVEMDMKLTNIEYVVFDEADRLFEMGFGEQLNEILHRLAHSKQMVMFSATLPKLLVDFAKAGLVDPVLIRLDVESKLPEALKLKFLYCRPEERYAVMFALLKYVIPSDEQTVIFAGTQHHVELISFLLTKAGISNTYIYSNLDPSARKINTAKFQYKKVSVLIVTDVAARGIDIPNLDFVINVHFPGKPKLFVHRVGRCARAGRSGTAYTIFSSDDQAHLLDLCLFLGKPFNIEDKTTFGVVPSDTLEDEHYSLLEWYKGNDVAGLYKTSNNAYKQYIKSRPSASAEANKRVKSIKFFALRSLDDFDKKSISFNINSKNKQSVVPSSTTELIEQKDDLLLKMKKYRPSGTIFELNPHHKSVQNCVMKNKRETHKDIIENFKKKQEEIEEMEQKIKNDCDADEHSEKIPLVKSSESDISSTFGKVISSKKRKTTDDLYRAKKKKAKTTKDEEHYIPYHAADKHTEDGLAINSFDRDARNAEFSVTPDNAEGQNIAKKLKKWDRIKKKMVSVQDPREGKIRTEAGIWIPATYKTGRYAEWKEKSKIEEQMQREDEENGMEPPINSKKYPTKQWARHNVKVQMKKRFGQDSEIKTPDQIVKRRIRLENLQNKQMDNQKKNAQKRKMGLFKHKGKGGKSGKGGHTGGFSNKNKSMGRGSRGKSKAGGKGKGRK